MNRIREFGNILNSYFNPKMIQKRRSLKKQVKQLQKDYQEMKEKRLKTNTKSIEAKVIRGEELKKEIGENLDTSKKDASLLYRVDEIVFNLKGLQKELHPSEVIDKIGFYTKNPPSPNAEELLVVIKELQKLTVEEKEKNAEQLAKALNEGIKAFEEPFKWPEEKTRGLERLTKGDDLSGIEKDYNTKRLARILELEKAIESIPSLYSLVKGSIEEAKINYQKAGIQVNATKEENAALDNLETYEEIFKEPSMYGYEIDDYIKNFNVLSDVFIRQNTSKLANIFSRTLERYKEPDPLSDKIEESANPQRLDRIKKLEESVMKCKPLYDELQEQFKVVRKNYGESVAEEENEFLDANTVFSNVQKMMPNGVTGDIETVGYVDKILEEFRRLSPEDEKDKWRILSRRLRLVCDQIAKKTAIKDPHMAEELKKSKLEKIQMIRNYVNGLNITDNDKAAMKLYIDGKEAQI